MMYDYDIHIHACNLQLTIVACFTIIAVEQCIFFSLDICVCRHGAHEHGAVIRAAGSKSGVCGQGNAIHSVVVFCHTQNLAVTLERGELWQHVHEFAVPRVPHRELRYAFAATASDNTANLRVFRCRDAAHRPRAARRIEPPL